jgi:ABC-type oligopeptide transport system substrate-binding subunit
MDDVPQRVWLSLVMLATGAALMVAAQLAGAAPERRGGIFKVGTTGASVQVDPQLAYITTAWWLEYATAAKLYNYRPGGKLVSEVASRFTVSNRGKRYTFFIRRGFRFSDGTRVTAASFKYAINRAANHDLASPAAQFITNTAGVDISGAKRVNHGEATDVSGVQAHGNKLVISLNRPSNELVAILAMPFFQATSTKVPLTKEVVSVSGNDLPSAGPYYVSRNDVNQLTSLRRNPYWKPGPGRTAPRNLAGLDLQWNLNEQTAFELVKANQLDEGPLPAAEVQNVANQYGVNRSRFWVKALSTCISEIALNNSRGLFQGNAAMRRAVNWAIDRTDYAGQSGVLGRTAWTHLLPPTYPGSITTPSLQPYAPRANVAKARAIAAGHFRDGKITMYYRASGSTNQAEAQLVRRDLINLGFQDANITMKGFTGGNIYDAMGKRGADFDLAVSIGWCNDYPFVNGTFPFPPFGGFPNSPKYRAKIEAALRLQGDARTKAIGRLDIEIMKNVAPTVVTNIFNNRYFFSNRVDPRSLSYHKVYQDWSIPSLALR